MKFPEAALSRASPTPAFKPHQLWYPSLVATIDKERPKPPSLFCLPRSPTLRTQSRSRKKLSNMSHTRSPSWKRYSTLSKVFQDKDGKFLKAVRRVLQSGIITVATQ